MATLFSAFPFLTRLFADSPYQGPQFKDAIRRTLAAVTVESSSGRIASALIASIS